MSDHLTRIRHEFSRQAEAMSSAAIFTDEQILARIREATDLTQHMRVLDLACGPGIVSEALAHDAGDVIACDITAIMLTRTRRRCADAGIGNIHCTLAHAEVLPFANATFDAVVNRAALHHFSNPAAVIKEMARVTKPSGRLVIVDVMSSENAEESVLHNALETLRDPSHVRMLPQSETLHHLTKAGIEIQSTLTWTNHREFDEWLRITNAPERIAPLRVIMQTLAKAGVETGINLQPDGATVVFEHNALLVVGIKPTGISM
jgi:ubiquinone/menaquinone biosynthesis C-methylase UbiE